jgi:hypothetical protein
VSALVKPNAELAYRVLDQIDAHPEQWDQSRWWRPSPACGTGGCFAGWAVQLSGGHMERDEFAYIVVKSGLGELDGRYVPVAAAALLGLPMDEAESEAEAENLPLFHESNDREDLGRLVAEIFGPRPGPRCPHCDAAVPDGMHYPTCTGCGRVLDRALLDDLPPNAGSAS